MLSGDQIKKTETEREAGRQTDRDEKETKVSDVMNLEGGGKYCGERRL